MPQHDSKRSTTLYSYLYMIKMYLTKLFTAKEGSVKIKNKKYYEQQEVFNVLLSSLLVQECLGLEYLAEGLWGSEE